ncbi:hypothetical protein HDF24_04680 [Mucilaginibacter sp. X4EP1]|uniref:hypothetical protein n=1 Tax=Mucilaginibacter sp. X4EP1 TaxID=2723092 RepID=UPI0021674265|nr:hypothetical protein [Mucilaginibacter sp. X4EP1]MCS3816497.1 hypothetical protein [Mucilaginibacter sp. X4EP1]
MNKISQDEIQQWVEKLPLAPGIEPGTENEADVKNYRLLFDLLDEGPKAELSYSFTANLHRRIQAITNRRIGLKWYGIAACLSILGFGFAYCLLFFYSANAAAGFAGVINKYKWMLLFIGACFLIVQFLEGYLNNRQKQMQ